MHNLAVSQLRLAEPVPAPQLLDEREAALRLQISPATLRLWRNKRRQGEEAPVLPFVQLGRLVKYRTEDVDEFLLQQIKA